MYLAGTGVSLGHRRGSVSAAFGLPPVLVNSPMRPTREARGGESVRARHPRKLRVLGEGHAGPMEIAAVSRIPGFRNNMQIRPTYNRARVYMPSCICVPFVRVVRTRVCAWPIVLEHGTWCTLRIFDAIPAGADGGWERVSRSFHPPCIWIFQFPVKLSEPWNRRCNPPQREDRQTKGRAMEEKWTIFVEAWIFTFLRAPGAKWSLNGNCLEQKFITSDEYRYPRRDKNWIISLGVFDVYFFFFFFYVKLILNILK